MPAIDPRPCAMMAFPSVGPYHFARFQAMRTALEAAGWRFLPVSFFAHDGEYAWKETPEQALQIEYVVQQRETGLVGGWRFCRRAIQLLRAQRVSALFAPSFWPWPNLFLALAAKLLGCRIILMTESWKSTARSGWHVRLAKGLLLKLYDAALVGGTPHRENLINLGFPAQKIQLGYDVVNNEDFKPCLENRRLLKTAESSRILLSVARFIPKKNLLALIEAYALATKQSPGLPPLVLSGGGILQDSLAEKARACGLALEAPARFADAILGPGGKIVLLAFSSQDDVRQMYSQAIGLILASLHEEWGLVVNEAMAAGLPVLVSNRVGCVRDLVADGENGYVFDPTSITDMSRQIIRLYHCWQEGSAWEAMSDCSLSRIALWTPDFFAANALAALHASVSRRI